MPLAQAQTLPNLPALLSLLIALDPAQPTYMGTSTGTKAGVPHYFQGLLYGLTWNVVSASANLPLALTTSFLLELMLDW